MNLLQKYKDHKKDLGIYSRSRLINMVLAFVMNFIGTSVFVVRLGYNRWWHILAMYAITNLILMLVGYTQLKRWGFNQTR